MISNLETQSPKKLAKELSAIFKNAIQEIEDLADKAPNQIVESVHLIRKRLKFLRAFVKLTQFCTEDQNYKPVNYILRDCGQILSDCRDAHVRGLLLEEHNQDDSFKVAVQELDKLNKKTTKKLEKKLLKDSVLFDELISDLNQKVVKEYIQSLRPDTNCLGSGLALGYEKSYHAFHSELKSHEADLLHEWRKRTKDLQYQLEALLESVPNQLSPTYDEVVDLCEILGRINDLFMFMDWIDSLRDSIKSKTQLIAFRDKLETELEDLENQADKMGDALFTLNPDEYREEWHSHLEA